MQGLLSRIQHPGSHVQGKGAPQQTVAGMGVPLLAAQMGVHPGPQFRHPEGFAQVIVPAGGQTLEHILLPVPGGEKQDRGPGQIPDTAAERHPVLPGHHHIQQKAVRPPAERRGHLVSRGAQTYPVPVPLQSGLQQGADGPVVVHSQYVCHHAAPVHTHTAQDAAYSRYTWAG